MELIRLVFFVVFEPGFEIGLKMVSPWFHGSLNIV